MAYTTKILEIKVVENDSVIVIVDDKQYAFDDKTEAASFVSDYISGL